MTGVRFELTTYGLKERQAATTRGDVPSRSGDVQGRTNTGDDAETRPNGGALCDKTCKGSTHPTGVSAAPSEPVHKTAFAAWVDAKDYLYSCESFADPKVLDALDTIWSAANDAGSVTVEIRTVSRADRRGDTRTHFASDIRYARAMYTVAEWAMPLLVARVRELEAVVSAAGLRGRP